MKTTIKAKLIELGLTPIEAEYFLTGDCTGHTFISYGIIMIKILNLGWKGNTADNSEFWTSLGVNPAQAVEMFPNAGF